MNFVAKEIDFMAQVLADTEYEYLIPRVRSDVKDYELALADKNLKITELARIIGITPNGIHKWGMTSKKLSYMYDFVKDHKPQYLPALERYIRIQVKRKINSLESRK